MLKINLLMIRSIKVPFRDTVVVHLLISEKRKVWLKICCIQANMKNLDLDNEVNSHFFKPFFACQQKIKKHPVMYSIDLN